MKIIGKIIKWIWIIAVLCWAGVCATLMGAFAMDAPSSSLVGGAIAFIIVFALVFGIGMIPLTLIKWWGAVEAESKKKMIGFSCLYAALITTALSLLYMPIGQALVDGRVFVSIIYKWIGSFIKFFLIILAFKMLIVKWRTSKQNKS